MMTPAVETSFPLTRSKRSAKNAVPYSEAALKQDLTRVRNAWEECQASRDRNAIYGYLSAVFNLVMWWTAEDRTVSRARWALRLNRKGLANDEPFAAVILCSSDSSKVDRRTRSKWSRVLRYAAEYKSGSEPLTAFVRRARAASTHVLGDLAVGWGGAVVAEARNRSWR